MDAATAEKRLDEIRKLKDAIRGRALAKDLYAAEQVMGNIHETAAERHYNVVSLRNGFLDSEEAFDGKPFVACNITLAPDNKNLPPYELQVVTENVALVSKLTHPVTINGPLRGHIALHPQLENHMTGLALGAAIQDAVEYLTRRG